MATYTVQSGNTASKIAQQYGTTVAELQKANPQYQQFASNPNYIQVGWNLNIPTTSPTPTGSSTKDLTSSTNQSMNIGNSPASPVNAGDIQAQIANITSQIGLMQQQVQLAQSAGLKPNEQIPGTPGSEKTTPTTVAATTPLPKEKSVTQTLLEKILGKTEERQAVATAAPTAEDIVNTTLAQYGITPQTYQEIQGLVGQMASYSNQIVDLENKKQAALDNIEGRPGISLEFMGQEQSRITRQYNREIATKSAQAGVVAQTIELKQGLIQDAQKTASLIIDAATYDQKQKLADMDWAIDTYKDLYDVMSQEEQRQWDNAYKISQDEYTKAKDEAKLKSDMVIEAAKNGVYLDFNKPLDELINDYAKKVSVVEAETTDRTTDTKFWSEIDAGRNELQQGETWGNVWNRIKAQFPNVSDAKIDNALGTTWKEPGAYQKWTAQKKESVTNPLQDYKDAGWTRKQIEEKWKSDNGITTLPENVKQELDKLFPATPKKWWEFWK